MCWREGRTTDVIIAFVANVTGDPSGIEIQLAKDALGRL
jgi:hypothetical protein